MVFYLVALLTGDPEAFFCEMASFIISLVMRKVHFRVPRWSVCVLKRAGHGPAELQEYGPRGYHCWYCAWCPKKWYRRGDHRRGDWRRWITSGECTWDFGRGWARWGWWGLRKSNYSRANGIHPGSCGTFLHSLPLSKYYKCIPIIIKLLP